MISFDTVMSKIAMPVLILATLILVFLIVELNTTAQSVAQTSAYTRVSNCIVAKLAGATIPQTEIEKCYVQVEKETGVSLERFDMQTHNERTDTTAK